MFLFWYARLQFCADSGVVSQTSKSLRGRLISDIFCSGGDGTISVRGLSVAVVLIGISGPSQ